MNIVHPTHVEDLYLHNYLLLNDVSHTDGVTYTGCYVDASERALSSDKIRTSDMTIETCLAHCRTSGHMYAGVQYSNECWCGYDYNKHGVADEADCNKTCSGNDDQFCGGTFRNSVFRLSKYLLANLIDQKPKPNVKLNP